MRLVSRARMITASALVTTSLLVLYPHGTLRAAENPAPVLLQSIDSSGVSIGSPLKLTLCVPEGRVNEVPTWQLALGGVMIAKAPCAVAVVGNCAPTDGQTAGGARTAPSPNGSMLRLTYDLDYEDERRAAWMRIFDQRNAADKVDVGLLAADGTPVRFAPPPAGTLPAVSEVIVRKYPSHWWIPLVIVGCLLAWLIWLRKTNTLRDSTLCAERYFRAQMEDFRDKRRQECALRRRLITEMMTKGIDNPITRINNILNEENEKQQESLSQALATELENKGIENADRKLAEVYTPYSENKRRAARLVKEMKEAGISDSVNPFDKADDFEAMINRPEIKNRLPPYSLGRLQMAWWFLIVIGGVALMYIATGTLFKIPESVLWLIGISVTTAGIGYAIDNRQPPSKLPPVSKSRLKDVLTDMQGGDTFYRWQMLVATLLLGVVFIIELVRNFVMTDFDLTMLGLMGISAGTYLGFKWPERSPTIPGPPVQQ
ncbi:MAG: hypothetical protein RKP20_04925 [Candidatus Competibacter sp.]|nr:hypothetical protein [Candidatus Competibacter sp.]